MRSPVLPRLPLRRRLRGLFVGTLLAAASLAVAADRPNIIFIMADDLGYGDLGCYGSRFIATPNIDRLAAEGMRFTHCYAGSPVCAPSRAVLLTGRHTGHARIRGNSPRVGGELEQYAGGKEGDMRLSLTAEDHTVAELLRSAGYRTGISGKWGLAEPGTDGVPTRRGFDEWLGYLNQNHAAYYYPDYLDANEGTRPLPANRNGARVTYSNDVMADFAVDYIRRHAPAPFFLYLPFTIPHNRMEVPELGDYAQRDWPPEAKIYAAMVTRLDGYVGRIMAELARLGLDDNTIVFFTSDNGAADFPRADVLHSGGGLRGRKGSLFEGGIRVPMIVRWPGRVPAARASPEPWMFADFLPTAAELAGLPPPDRSDGQGVLAVLTGRAASLGERAFYWEIPSARLHQAARLGRWKGLRYGIDAPLELYDLAADPQETTNTAADHPDVVTRLQSILDRAHVPSPHWPVR